MSTVSPKNIQALSKVILPVIRRVMPTLIANDIIGVQPMTGPGSMIYSLRNKIKKLPRYYPITLQPEHYRYFVRLYNRRMTQSAESIDAARYKFATHSGDTFNEINWCEKTFAKGSFIVFHNIIWFANDSDWAFYKVKFADENTTL